MKIVDAHHHLWDLNRHYPFMHEKGRHLSGGNPAISSSYLIGNFLADIEGTQVSKSVHIQAGIEPSQSVAETAWLQHVADDKELSRGFPHAIIARTDPSSPDAEAELERHCQYRNVRGIRHLVHEYVANPAKYPEYLKMLSWRSGLKLMRRHGLVFELLIYQQQMSEAAEIIRDNADILFVIEHSGLPTLQSREALDRWRRQLTLLSELPNTVIKISGFAMLLNSTGWSLQAIKPIIATAVELFGAKRCMFGSNFPFDKFRVSYRQLWQDFEVATSEYSQDERAALFYDTAQRVYRL